MQQTRGEKTDFEPELNEESQEVRFDEGMYVSMCEQVSSITECVGKSQATSEATRSGTGEEHENGDGRCEEARNEREGRGEICGKGEGKGNGGKGEHACRGEGVSGKGAVGMMKGDDEGEEDEEKKGTRRPRWADWDGEEEARQGTSEGKWHKARKEQGIIWLDGSDEEHEGQEGSAGGRGERCEVRNERVSGRVEVWNEENEESKEDEEAERGVEVLRMRRERRRRMRTRRGERRTRERRKDRGERKEERRKRREERRGELRRNEREVNAQEERTEQEREVEAQEGQEEDVNSVRDECHVSNRHMTWWQNAWWIRVDHGPHMRSARGRRRTWRAARQAAEQVRNGNWAGETREGAEEAERQKGEKRRREPQTERQTRHGSENTLHIVFHLPEMATATTAPTTAARTLQ